jgi:hypothetical protein
VPAEETFGNPSDGEIMPHRAAMVMKMRLNLHDFGIFDGRHLIDPNRISLQQRRDGGSTKKAC